MAANVEKIGTMVNGWLVMTKTGLYGTDYLTRAVVTMVGLGANLPQDAVYPAAKVDGEGRPLSGAIATSFTSTSKTCRRSRGSGRSRCTTTSSSSWTTRCTSTR